MDNFDLKKYLAEGKLLKEGNMKTPMQELISAIRKRQEDEDVQPFMLSLIHISEPTRPY